MSESCPEFGGMSPSTIGDQGIEIRSSGDRQAASGKERS